MVRQALPMFWWLYREMSQQLPASAALLTVKNTWLLFKSALVAPTAGLDVLEKREISQCHCLSDQYSTSNDFIFIYHIHYYMFRPLITAIIGWWLNKYNGWCYPSPTFPPTNLFLREDKISNLPAGKNSASTSHGVGTGLIWLWTGIAGSRVWKL
jgi:hypothetical protein